ncbi:hypothetical protein HQ590_05320 [bacterium]|nr:hypothetical protein [bacterium]
MSKPVTQTIHVHNRIHRPLPNQPVTYGVPWPEGAVRDPAELILTDAAGREQPVGHRVLNTWTDGSAQWTLVDFAVDLAPSGSAAVTLRPGRGACPGPLHPVIATAEATGGRIGNGLVDIAIGTAPGGLLEHWRVNGRDLVVRDGLDIRFEDPTGVEFTARAGPRRITVEHATPLRAVLRIDGQHGAAAGRQMLDYFLRLEVWAGRQDVVVTHSFRNREQVVPGIVIRSFQLVVQTATEPGAQRCFTAMTVTRHYLSRYLRVTEDPEIIASDTVDLPRYAETHHDWQMGAVMVADRAVLHDPVEERPWYLQEQKYRAQYGGDRRVWPYLALLGDAGGVLGSFLGMANLHPKSLQSQGSALRFGLWPDWAGPLSITQGAGRSHRLGIAPVPAGADDTAIQNQYLAWEIDHERTPIEVQPDLDHVRACRVFAVDKLPPYDPAGHYLFERKVLVRWLGVSAGRLGEVDEIDPWPASGLWNYGDYGGGGAAGNNEEMNALKYFQNHLRTGNWGCLEKGLAAATHLLEVDHAAFSIDPWQNGGMVAHCLHHNDGAAYPSHMWFTELLFAYALTGDEEYRAAARRGCENLLHWINTPEGFRIISGDQREAGQPMINLTWCWHFHRDPRYLAACEKIVRDYLMANTAKYGRMLDEKPVGMPVKIVRYGDYAAFEGMYWLWEITRDEPLRQFLLGQLDWRLTLPYVNAFGAHRSGADFHPAAYGYLLTGDRSWLDRVGKPFRAAFRAGQWQLDFSHSMYFIKPAFELGLITDDDVTV